MANIAGIDLGTTFSALAVLNAIGRPEILPNADGERLTPSAIFFDEDNPELHQKRLLCREIRDVEGVPSPMKAVMIDMEDNSDTVIEYQEITYQVELPEELFTIRGMKR